TMRLCFPVIFMLSLRHGECPHTFVSEGSDVEISCDKDIASLLHWFRVTDAGGVEFLLSFKGDEVKVQSLPSNIEPKGGGRSLVVRDFRRRRDGGSYTCTRINNNQLEFGRVTVLEPPPVAKGFPHFSFCNCAGYFTLFKSLPMGFKTCLNVSPLGLARRLHFGGCPPTSQQLLPFSVFQAGQWHRDARCAHSLRLIGTT
uniref:Ig-like domain-containing protein n=1 Tax=Denticeps clupeoides TaxID=299321 RepID=A0AAY4AEU5_9TELE